MKTWKILVGILPLSVLTVPSAAQEAAARAAAHMNAGRFAEAAQTFEQAIAKEPTNASLHKSQGLAYQSLKQYDRAIQSMERAVQLAPSDGAALYSLALLYEALAYEKKQNPSQNLSRAKAVWEKLLQADASRGEVARRHIQMIEEQTQP